ncbi:MAG TPA: SMP-30/gluconolactonase/LRE family protein, partial [Acidimicrobiales bacterium]
MSEPSQDPVQLTSTVVLEGLAYPECPRWRDGRLYFSDQYAGRVVALDPNGAATTVVEVPGRPSGLGWMPDGDMLVVSMLEHRVYRWSGGALRVHAELRDHHPGPSNDMVVDSHGRAYVGNIGFDFYGGEQPRTTTLVLVEPDGRVRTVADDLLVPNGMVLLAEESELVVAESFAHRLTAFTIQPDGSLTDRRCYADLDGQIPDGICKDPA